MKNLPFPRIAYVRGGNVQAVTTPCTAENHT